jgi:hypothetical protein
MQDAALTRHLLSYVSRTNKTKAIGKNEQQEEIGSEVEAGPEHRAHVQEDGETNIEKKQDGTGSKHIHNRDWSWSEEEAELDKELEMNKAVSFKKYAAELQDNKVLDRIDAMFEPTSAGVIDSEDDNQNEEDEA